MLKNISLIASVISALTAITTSFRALGKSREDSRSGINESSQAKGRSKGLLLYLFVTFVWFGLSIIFAVPLIKERLSSSPNTSLLPIIVPFALVVIVCCLIWQKALSLRN